MAANPTSRATFAQNCVDLIKEYDFDGIDIGKIIHAMFIMLWKYTKYL